MTDAQRNHLNMKRLTEMSPAKAISTTLRWVGGKNARRRELALMVFRRDAQTAASWLVDQLFVRGRRTVYRLLVLDALELLGEPLPATRFFDLQLALHRFSPVVAHRSG